MSAPETWATLLSRLQHLHLTNSSTCTAAAAVCLSLASNLTSLHMSGCPSQQALASVTSTVPYISPERPIPCTPASAQPVQEHGIIPVPLVAVQLIAAAVLTAKEPLPCRPEAPRHGIAATSTHGDSTPTAQAAAPIKDHAVVLPTLRSLTTDASHLVHSGSIAVLDQHPPADLLTRLPRSIPRRQQDQQDAPTSHTVCLTSIAAAIAARALTLPTTPPSAPAWLVAQPHVTHMHAPYATLLSNPALLAPLTSLALKGIAQSADGLPPSIPHLQALTFPLPLNLLEGVPRSFPPPGVSSALTKLHLAPTARSTMSFSTLARLVLDCPALVDLDVSRCVTAPPAVVIAPRAANPVHFFLHIQADLEAEGGLPIGERCIRGPPAPLRRFACDEAPGCLYLLSLLDGVHPVRALEHVSMCSNLCLPGRLIALLMRQPCLQALRLLRSSRAVSPPQVCLACDHTVPCL